MMETVRAYLDMRRALREGREGIERRQRRRLADAVAHARVHSRYYAELYAGLPDRIEDPTLLPVTDKTALMGRFDDWVTDPEVTLERVREFVADPERAGETFLGRYLVATTSGTSGTMGLFLMGGRTMDTVLPGLVLRSLGPPLLRALPGMLAGGGRSARVLATGGHFAAYAGARALLRQKPRMGGRMRLLSVQDPLPGLVAELEEFRPAVLECYASTGRQLADEAEAGRLTISPVLVSLGGERLPEEECERIARVFGARINNLYACNESPSLTSQCAQGWLHVHEDWVVLEPVEADHSPTPAGQRSHSVLLSVLYRYEQPILRYDLGDSVVTRTDPCPCGNPALALKVSGRAAEVLEFAAEGGGAVTLTPLALETLVERTPGIRRMQIVQRTPSALVLRLQVIDGVDAGAARRKISAELVDFLGERGLSNVSVECADESPRQTAGGKTPTVVPYRG